MAKRHLQKYFAWFAWIEPWYLSYALLGATIAGFVPILIPLMISTVSTATIIGLVIALSNLGGLTAPWVGVLADRYHWHRQFLVGGFLLTTIGAAGFSFTSNLALWLILALFIGVGAAASSTVANLFIVERHPKAEWDVRIGWLQTFYAGGQVAGLLLAGSFSHNLLQIGLWVAASCTALGFFWSFSTTRGFGRLEANHPSLPNPAKQGEWSAISPQRMYHYPNLALVKRLFSDLASRYTLFQVAWFLSFTGAASIFALYPVLMVNLYGLQPTVSTSVFAIAAALSLVLYNPAGYYTKRSGAAPVFSIGLIIRLLAVLIMLLTGIFQAIPGWFALLGFIFIVFAWSLLSVSATAWVAEISPFGEGEGIGIFNGVTAVASVFGAVLGGWAAGKWGYSSVPILALIGIGSGLFITGMVAVQARQANTAQDQKTRIGQ